MSNILTAELALGEDGIRVELDILSRHRPEVPDKGIWPVTAPLALPTVLLHGTVREGHANVCTGSFPFWVCQLAP